MREIDLPTPGPGAKSRNKNEQDEHGSVTPLIIGFFTVCALLIFLISNVSSAYTERRKLTAHVEEALAIAAQEIDLFKYYYSGPLTDYMADNLLEDGNLRVPIDCDSAERVFTIQLTSVSLQHSLEIDIREEGPEILSFSCDGSNIAAVVKDSFELPFQLPVLGITHFENKVQAGITSRYK